MRDFADQVGGGFHHPRFAVSVPPTPRSQFSDEGALFGHAGNPRATASLGGLRNACLFDGYCVGRPVCGALGWF